MQHTDKAIAEFEAWWNLQPHREQFEDVKDQMRNVWRASRRELVAQMPQPMKAPPYASYEGGWNDMRGEAIDAIEAAGVTVRG
ncbi:hypothetical protein ACYKDZ_13970 [Stutzerimonas stutzeri]